MRSARSNWTTRCWWSSESHVTYRLVADETQRATIERVLGFHADRCPVARTIGGCVEMSTSLELEATDHRAQP
jgi:hypothetical protein